MVEAYPPLQRQRAALDALGRFASRSVAGSLESGPDGSRLATKDASTTAYLHGNVAAAVASGGTTIVVWVS